MAPPIALTQWLQREYPRPQIDPEWLSDCYAWIESQYHFDPATQLDEIIHHVNVQLLESDLSDSMIPGSGLPQNIADVPRTTIRGDVLVQIISITEIGHSAFTLQNVHQARLEREDMAGLARDEDDDEEGIPSYPRSMLRFQLSDGSTILQAIEFRHLEELVLGETKLGHKMILKNVPIRKGVAFLEPKCIVMKGHQVTDLEAFQERDFARGLRFRLGKPDDPAEEEPEQQIAVMAQEQRQVAPNSVSLPMQSVRSPLRELDELVPVAGPSGISHVDDVGQPRKRKLPDRSQRSPSPNPPPRQTGRQETQSRFFESQSRTVNPSAGLANERLLSPHRQQAIFVPNSDEEDGELWQLPGNRKRGDTSIGEGPSRRGTAATTSPKAASSELYYDDDDFLDDAFLAQVDRAEREALAPSDEEGIFTATSSIIPADPGTTQRTEGASSQRIAAGPSLQSTYTSHGSAGMSASGSASTVVADPSLRSSSRGRAIGSRINLDVVTIEDSDEDDKENVPALTRHVRRRTAPTQDDVIELSD
ncbi:uncharacterized protein FIBRA_03444 [Fibroporia radiculosa]|uniref:RecQ-mediated genome instability protein 1 n=1 Tax=Fibroporia radiculosa TaxID=599839 RepID=J4G5I9_9APHY|nr:uncharacterized protein FIBRA_03444 [Fibroporia radiculosa]CCM01393.1 predicted protein [Fibroporia radiculosa]